MVPRSEIFERKTSYSTQDFVSAAMEGLLTRPIKMQAPFTWFYVWKSKWSLFAIKFLHVVFVKVVVWIYCPLPKQTKQKGFCKLSWQSSLAHWLQRGLFSAIIFFANDSDHPEIPNIFFNVWALSCAIVQRQNHKLFWPKCKCHSHGPTGMLEIIRSQENVLSCLPKKITYVQWKSANGKTHKKITFTGLSLCRNIGNQVSHIS